MPKINNDAVLRVMKVMEWLMVFSLPALVVGGISYFRGLYTNAHFAIRLNLTSRVE